MDASEALLRGELTVKDSSTDSAGYVQYLKLWNGDLTVESGNFHQIIETGSGSVGTITITGGTAEDVTHTSPNVTFQLSGGTFDWISISSTCGENVFPSDLLADGYAYANKNSGAIQNGYAEDFSSVSDVKVVKHDHTWNDGTCACGYTCSHTAVDENGNCTVCKKPMAAMVTKGGESRAYAALNDALSAADDGGTVKLLANAGEITISRPLKLDLNGKTAAKLTVTGDVTLASLLPEGYTFKSGSTWITDPSGKELTNVSMAKLPIKSMNYPTELSMTYGGTGTLLVTVTKETGAGVVRFQWYKVEDGKETAVGSATTSNRFDLAAQNLSAGRHTFRFSGTCDGYKKMSEDIAVTVQKASIGANRITPPTAQENLTYTGQVFLRCGRRDGLWHHAVQPDRERHIQSGHPCRHRCRNVYRVVSGDWRCKPQRYRTRQRGGQYWKETADDHQGSVCGQDLRRHDNRETHQRDLRQCDLEPRHRLQRHRQL